MPASQTCPLCGKEYPMSFSPSAMIGMKAPQWSHTPSSPECLQVQIVERIGTVMKELERHSTILAELESLLSPKEAPSRKKADTEPEPK